MPAKQFPDSFLWGAATASYQIEGAFDLDGRGESIWDRFSKTEGKVKNGDTGDTACDHYHRYPEDIEWMRWLGLDAYRFSIAWPRIHPDGGDRVNTAGLDFYDRLVDQLLEADIQPFPTLYHWDLPQALQEPGGWANRATVYRFAAYTRTVTERLGDRVKQWMTLNEPWCSAMLGHQIGNHAPGVTDWYTALRAAHHLLVAHGSAVEVIRENVPEAEVGIVLNFEHVMPASQSAADRRLARIKDGYANRWFISPVSGRGYPADMVEHYTELDYLPNGLDFVIAGDMDTIAAETDFLGINYYSRSVIRDERILDNAPQVEFRAPPEELTDIGWEIYPDGLTAWLIRAHYEYQFAKLYITENGAAFNEGPSENGIVQDERRVDYYQMHVAAAERAIAAGVPLEGYFFWSLLDNFEWAEGYTQRFGMIHVDYETQKRTPKESAKWYRSLINRPKREDLPTESDSPDTV